MKSLSRVRLYETPWTEAYQAPPSMGFFRQEYWSGVPLPSPWTAYFHWREKKFYLLEVTVIFGFLSFTAEPNPNWLEEYS